MNAISSKLRAESTKSYSCGKTAVWRSLRFGCPDANLASRRSVRLKSDQFAAGKISRMNDSTQGVGIAPPTHPSVRLAIRFLPFSLMRDGLRGILSVYCTVPD